MNRWMQVAALAALSLSAACADSGSAAASAAPAAGLLFSPQAISLIEVPEENRFRLTDEALVFRDSAGVEWTAPRGTLTDGASVPRSVLPVTNGRFDAMFLKAAVVHDAWCQEFNQDVCPDQYRRRPWTEVHRMFHEACLAGGTPEVLAEAMYLAVYWLGPRWDLDPEDAVEEDEEELPLEARRAEYERMQTWVRQERPTIQRLDQELRRREVDLRKSLDLRVPRTLEQLKPRALEVQRDDGKVRLIRRTDRSP